jgi:GDP/UDP-N,N'-diacetylbacillosamine 2-epimerase (hydrolysing)
MIDLTLLSSSRADIGIYSPFISACIDDADVDLRIIAFGSHIIQNSIRELDQWRASVDIIALDIPDHGDDVSAMLQHSVETISRFDSILKAQELDSTIVISLGDRFEMFAAVQAWFAHGIPIAHLHGGETTLGAVDEVYRHCISHMSDVHLTTHPDHSERLRAMLGDADIHTIGSLSLDGSKGMELMSDEDFELRFGIDIRKKPVLITFHPVTKAQGETSAGLESLIGFMRRHQEETFLITMPNIDPGNQSIRRGFLAAGEESEHIQVVESLGKEGYFKAMSSCKMVIGNSSSALLETASFGIYAINMGSRQLGRTSNPNVKHVPCRLEDIEKAYVEIMRNPKYDGGNEFYNPDGAAQAALRILKHKYG